MLAGLIILIPVLLLVGFTIWAVYRCRAQTIAYQSRPGHPSTRVEVYGQELETAQEQTSEARRSCLDLLDGYFSRGSMILGGRGGGWGVTRHLTQVRRHHTHPVGSFQDREEKW